MRRSRPMPRNQVTFLVILLLLAGLGVVFWFADPNHRRAGPSRVEWPAPGKP